MDLSMMKTLKYIDCPATCFFRSGTAYSTRGGLYKLLPSSLEELTIRFEYWYGLECWGDAVSNYGDDDSAEFLWLVELASNKTEYNPQLKVLRLEDCDMTEMDNEEPRVGPWDPPLIVAETLGKAEIHFTASVALRPSA
ncbi:uncharacterized protein BP5553_07559 [Venustampulla echinocandica]|uniref:Uncharacterized protein n=1 Tax=Venustampulla echinocandica TaxID=2656787 RepID=A0A370TGV1_9HELO|nr:uncharacterized protein BP5553_07559 [Venustampulla echinocandica]RDL34431.1 hypothetical protein BP5553_07559 [Venustampulla echinocandica]